MGDTVLPLSFRFFFWLLHMSVCLCVCVSVCLSSESYHCSLRLNNLRRNIFPPLNAGHLIETANLEMASKQIPWLLFFPFFFATLIQDEQTITRNSNDARAPPFLQDKLIVTISQTEQETKKDEQELSIKHQNTPHSFLRRTLAFTSPCLQLQQHSERHQNKQQQPITTYTYTYQHSHGLNNHRRRVQASHRPPRRPVARIRTYGGLVSSTPFDTGTRIGSHGR